MKKLSKNTYYKFLVVAVKSTGDQATVLSASKVIHITTTGKKNNYKKVTVKKSKVTLSTKKKKSKTYKLAGKAVKKGRKAAKHRGLTYVSDNTKVATVNKKGVVKAVAKGKCNIYVYAQDGTYKKVKVTVK